MMIHGDYRAAFPAAEDGSDGSDVLLPVCECCGKATSDPLVSSLTGDVVCGAACLVKWESEGV